MDTTWPLLCPRIALALFAGRMSSKCVLPMKFARSWMWENTWLVFRLVSLIVLLWATALMKCGAFLKKGPLRPNCLRGTFTLASLWRRYRSAIRPPEFAGLP